MNWYKIAQANNFLYHGTTEGRAIQIAKQGLLPGKEAGNTLSNEIFLSDTEEYAKSYADRKGGAKGVILRVSKTPEIIADINTGLKGDFKTTKGILPKNIEIKTQYGWKKLTEFYKL